MWSGRFLRDIWKHFTHKILNHLSDRILFPAFCLCCQPQKIENWGGKCTVGWYIYYAPSLYFLYFFSLHKNQQCFEICRKLDLRIAKYHVSLCMFQGFFIPTLSRCSFQQTKGGLFFPGCNLSIIMAGMERVLSLPALIPTSVMTSLSVIQSNPQSCLLGAFRVMALVLLSSPILPPPFPPFALKLPLLELLSCPNRYNLRRLPVLRRDGTYLSRALFCAQSYPTMHPVTRNVGLARWFRLAPELCAQRQRFKCVSYFLLHCWHQNVSNLSVFVCACTPRNIQSAHTYTCTGHLHNYTKKIRACKTHAGICKHTYIHSQIKPHACRNTCRQADLDIFYWNRNFARCQQTLWRPPHPTGPGAGLEGPNKACQHSPVDADIFICHKGWASIDCQVTLRTCAAQHFLNLKHQKVILE